MTVSVRVIGFPLHQSGSVIRQGPRRQVVLDYRLGARSHKGTLGDLYMQDGGRRVGCSIIETAVIHFAAHHGISRQYALSCTRQGPLDELTGQSRTGTGTSPVRRPHLREKSTSALAVVCSPRPFRCGSSTPP